MVRLGFLGTGWIGRSRMEAMLETGQAKAVAIFDPDPEMLRQAHALAADAVIAGSSDELLAQEIDGVVIATPSALHCEQCVQAFTTGKAVFCQKPLGRSSLEVEQVLNAASRADRLLGVDLSYRHTAAMQAIREQVRSGALGRVFAADLVFHNAFGPQSGWFWDPKLSGGGCLIDLGVHLVDLLLWLFDFPEVLEAHGTLLRDGCPVSSAEVEDYATGELRLSNDVHARIVCSWNVSAGRDAVIEASFFGSQGGAAMRNRDGSFFDFSAELHHRQERTILTSPPDQWGGRAAVEWIGKLARGERFAGSTAGLLETAKVLDRLYGVERVGKNSEVRSNSLP